MEFHKTLAKYYHAWLRDCFDSADYCFARNNTALAQKYIADGHAYAQLIADNWDAIEFFSVGDRAFRIESTLPTEFRGY